AGGNGGNREQAALARTTAERAPSAALDAPAEASSTKRRAGSVCGAGSALDEATGVDRHIPKASYLEYRDENGLFADFHANRHTLVGELAAALRWSSPRSWQGTRTLALLPTATRTLKRRTKRPPSRALRCQADRCPMRLQKTGTKAVRSGTIDH